MAEMQPSTKKPAVYGRATSLDGRRAVIKESRRAEYDASVARLRAAAAKVKGR